MNEIDTAIAHVQNGDYEKGMAILKQVAQTADDDTLFNIAQLYFEWGRIPEAKDILERLLVKHPHDSNLVLFKAEIEIDDDKEEEAIDLLTKIHELDENYLSAQLLLADLYQLQGLEEAAESRLKKAYKMAPNNPVLSYALGEFYRTSGQANHAINYYKDALHAEELEHEDVMLKLGEVLSLNGQFEEALIYYKKGIEQHQTLDGLFGYGVTAYQAQKYQTAISVLEDLKTMDPQYSTLYPVLAGAYKEEGAVEEALQTLESGIQLDEHNERLYEEAAQLAKNASKYDEAVNYYQELLRISPDNEDALKSFALLRLELEDYEGIIDLLGSRNDDDPELNWFLGKAYFEEDDMEQALKVYENANANFAEDPGFQKEYGEILWQLGKRDKALSHLKQSLALDPDNNELALFVERIEQDF